MADPNKLPDINISSSFIATQQTTSTRNVQSPAKENNFRKSPVSPFSDGSIASPIPWNNVIFRKSCSSTPDSEVEASLAYNKADASKRKRKGKKKNQPSRTHAQLEKTTDAVTTGESDFEYHQTLQKVKAKNKNLSSSDESDVNPSCMERYVHSVNLNHVHYEVVSIGVQTDWSWLRDKQKEKKKDEELDDLEKVKENLTFGMYGGFYKPTEGIPLPSKPKTNGDSDESNKRTIMSGATKTQNKETKEQQMKNTKNEDLYKDKKLEKTKQLKVKKKRRVKSAMSKSKVTNYDSDVSDGSKSCTSFSNIKPSNPTKSGPPDIIKYHREKSGVSQKPVPVLELNSPVLDLPLAENVPSGLFSGMCQFCMKPIIEYGGNNHDNDNTSLDQMFCCPEYEHFMKLHIENQDDEPVEDELIDISIHTTNFTPSKVSRKSNRDKTSERIRERELERQRAVAQQANLFSFARQMKTIQYSLASWKFMAQGWSVKPVSPLPEEPAVDEDLFQVDFNTSLLQKAAVLQERFYDNGKKLLTIFPDGTGCCYYPNGGVAVFITSTEEGKYTYIVQKNCVLEGDIKEAGLLAVFESNGNCICYYQKDEKLRLFVNAHGGIELDKKGGKRKRWQWYFIKGHVHAPPFQPLCFPLNKMLSVRVIDQHNIALIFSAKQRTLRFNVGSNIKAVKYDGVYGSFEADKSESYLQIQKKKIDSILTQLHSVLRLPNSTRFDRIYKSLSPKKKDRAGVIEPLPPIEQEPSVIVN